MADKKSFWDFGFGSFLNNMLFGLPSLIGGLVGSSRLTGAEREQNAFNAQQAQLQRDFEAGQVEQMNAFNAEQAEINRQFQADMSNTAYQRSVADMQRAGLNPALAYGNGAASTPSGAMATAGAASGSAASGSGRGIPFTMSEVMSALKMRKEMKVLDEQAKNIAADTLQKQTLTEGQRLANEWNPQLWASQLGLNDKTLSKLESEVASLLASTEGQRLANEWNPQLWANELENGKVYRHMTMVGIAKVQQEIQNLIAEKQLTLADRDLKILMQGLTSAQTVLTNSQATFTTEQAWREDWKNDFRANHGIDPEAGLWQLVTQVVGKKVSSIQDAIKDWSKNH